VAGKSTGVGGDGWIHLCGDAISLLDGTMEDSAAHQSKARSLGEKE
jgi:hypothetical protein